MSAFVTARALRDGAKAELLARWADIRGELAERTIGGRIVDRIVGDAGDVVLEAADIVENHKIVVTGTLAAIALWFLRNPIIIAFRRLSARISKRRRGVWS